MKALTAARLASKAVRTSPGEVPGLWDKYFPEIPLSDTRWFERYERKIVEEAIRTYKTNVLQGPNNIRLGLVRGDLQLSIF